MSQPSITITEQDGALGVLPASAGKLLAFVGGATAGPINTPATFGRPKDVIATFESGPLVEAACHALERYGKPVVLVRTDTSTAGTVGAIDDDAVTGTSVVTVDEDSEAVDDLEVVIKIVKGGTIGVTGITFQYSLDGGRSWSPIISLGTANTYTVPDSGVTFNFAAGTLLVGDTASTRTTSPAPSGPDLTAGLEALRLSAVNWEIVEPVNAVDATAFDALELKIGAMHAAGKYTAWVGNTRMPNAGESEAAYLTALTGIFGSKAALYGELCAGACKMTSSVSGRKYRRPISYIVGARQASVSEEVNIADVNLGTLVGVSIRDANGNPDEHDESISPGLDDARFTVLRTIEGIGGVFVNRPRLFSSAGSDFELFPHRRVMNVGNEALRLYFLRRLNRAVLVSKATGFILEEEALEIEAGALGVLRGALLAKPKASDVQFALSRVDNLLSTKTMTGDMRIVPLAYTEFVTLTVGFLNPALQVQAV